MDSKKFENPLYFSTTLDFVSLLSVTVSLQQQRMGSYLVPWILRLALVVIFIIIIVVISHQHVCYCCLLLIGFYTHVKQSHCIYFYWLLFKMCVCIHLKSQRTWNVKYIILIELECCWFFHALIIKNQFYCSEVVKNNQGTNTMIWSSCVYY